MHLQELPQYVAIDIQEALEERFMESEAMYVRFLRKLLTTDDYRLMRRLLPQKIGRRCCAMRTT